MIVFVSSVLYLVRVGVDRGKVFNYLFGRCETSLRVFVVTWLEVLLSIASHIIEQVKHLVFFVLEVICVALEFALDLDLLAEKGRVLTVR